MTLALLHRVPGAYWKNKPRHWCCVLLLSTIISNATGLVLYNNSSSLQVIIKANKLPHQHHSWLNYKFEKIFQRLQKKKNKIDRHFSSHLEEPHMNHLKKKKTPKMLMKILEGEGNYEHLESTQQIWASDNRTTENCWRLWIEIVESENGTDIPAQIKWW